MVKYWELANTILTDSMHLIGNVDYVCSFRIEIFQSRNEPHFRAKVWKICHFDLTVAGSESEAATEEIMTCEESFGFDDIRDVSEQLVLAQIVEALFTRYRLVLD